MTDDRRPIVDPATGEVIDGWYAHPAADLFPMAQEDELAGLAADIEQNGLVEAIWTADTQVVLDGRNRLVACHRLGMQPTVRRYSGDDPVTFAVSQNLHRRHLEKSQKAAIAQESLELYAEEARQRQAAAGGDKFKADKPLGADLHQAVDGKRAPRAADRAAAAFEVSGRLVGQVDRVAKQAPDLLPEIKAGKLSADAAEKIVKQRQLLDPENTLSSDEQELLAKLDAGATVILHLSAHARLAARLNQQGRLVKIDRSGPWGNPFILKADGDRETVIQNYAAYFLPNKPSLLEQIHTLRGKALGCWCAPEPCHGDVLKAEVER